MQSVQRGVGSAVAQTWATYGYTPNGLPASLKDARNNLTSYQYDGHDRRIKALYPDPATANTSSLTDFEQYGFDANANLTSLRKRNGQSITLAYDNLNRLTSRAYPTLGDNVSYGYDLLGRRISATGAAAADNVAYVFDNAGRLTSTTANGKTLSYQVDAAGSAFAIPGSRWGPKRLRTCLRSSGLCQCHRPRFCASACSARTLGIAP